MKNCVFLSFYVHQACRSIDLDFYQVVQCICSCVIYQLKQPANFILSKHSLHVKNITDIDPTFLAICKIKFLSIDLFGAWQKFKICTWWESSVVKNLSSHICILFVLNFILQSFFCEAAGSQTAKHHYIWLQTSLRFLSLYYLVQEATELMGGEWEGLGGPERLAVKLTLTNLIHYSFMGGSHHHRKCWRN